MKSPFPDGAMEDRLIGITSRRDDRDDQEPLDESSEVERRISAALHAIMPAWQPTAADHQWLLDALEHTPQDESLPPEYHLDIQLAVDVQPAPALTPRLGVTLLDRSDIADKISAGKVVAVPEVIDDQAAPRDVLKRCFREGIAPADHRAQAILTPWVQREFRRALINSEMLVINPTFLESSPALIAMCGHNSANQEGMVALLNRGAIVPFIRAGNDPVTFQSPRRAGPESESAWFTVAKTAQASGGITAVRLDRDDAVNARLYHELIVRRFQAVSTNLSRRNLGQLCNDLGLHRILGDNLLPLLELLTIGQNLAADLALRRASAKGDPGHIARTDFYRAFVSSQPEIGRYDGGALLNDPQAVLADTDWKDWAPRFAQLQQRHDRDVLRACGRGIKELVDLLYNTCFPDALGTYSLTPQGALPRTALQEMDIAAAEAGGYDRLQAKHVLEMVRSKVFSDAMARFCAPETDDLSLAQIVQLRESDAWKAYMTSLGKLLRTPAAFAEEAPAVYTSYMEMVRAIRPVPQTCARELEPTPRLKIQIDGAAVDVVWNGDQIIWEQRAGIDQIESIDRAQLSLQFGICDNRGEHGISEWSTMTEFYRGPIPDPIGAMRTIVQGLEEMRDAQTKVLTRVGRPSTLDLPA